MNVLISTVIGLALLVDGGVSTPGQMNEESCPTMPVLSCPQSVAERGSTGFPGKRGPRGKTGRGGK